MKSQTKALLVTEKRIFGFRINDLLGIAIMAIPFLISINFNHVVPGRRIWFVELYSEKTTNIRPGLVSALCGAVFYAALIVRYDGMFRTRNLFEAFVSIVRTFLNCWVIASLISLVVPASIPENTSIWSVFFKNIESTLLLFGILLSWLGMKTIAGYSWILFILAAWKRLLIVNSTMGMLGAVYILTIAISLGLQITDLSIIRDFANDFRTKTSRGIGSMKEDINAAGNDVSRKTRTVEDLIGENVTAYTGVRMPASSDGASFTREAPAKENSSNVKLNLESLDLNKDGVVDEKDFLLLNQKKGKDE